MFPSIRERLVEDIHEDLSSVRAWCNAKNEPSYLAFAKRHLRRLVMTVSASTSPTSSLT
jgi:hypothetical protein